MPVTRAARRRALEHHEPILWTITPWKMNGRGGWTQTPWILVEGRPAFSASHPNAYIAKLLELHDDPLVVRAMNLYTLVGEFKDGLEYYWETKEQEQEQVYEKTGNQDGHRAD